MERANKLTQDDNFTTVLQFEIYLYDFEFIYTTTE